MKFFYLLSFFLIFSMGCLEKAPKKENEAATNSTEDGPAERQTVELTAFSGFPKEIEGCSCYFGLDSSAVLKEDFVFVSSYDSIAFIALNNKAVMLQLTESNRSKSEFGDTDHDEKYANDSLKLHISWKYQNKTGFESWWSKGSMQVYLHDSLLGDLSFVGEC